MTARWETRLQFAASKSAAPVEAKVLKRTQSREKAAPAVEIRRIAAWVKEGGAGGEAKK